MFKALASEADNECAMIDSTIVRAHQPVLELVKKGDHGIGRSKGGLSTKMHTTVDVLVTPPGLPSSRA